jgi:CheY-like chemotaxis protein
MPNLDGPEATRRIRQLPGPASRVPVIALTAGLFDDEQERCFAAGMNELVAKPFTRASLVEALKRVT